MKKFFVFVIICVVTLGLGFTVFRFMAKEEILYVNQTIYEVNSNVPFTIDVVEENLKATTSVSVKSNNTDIVEPNADGGKYDFIARSGGSTTITVSSNMKGFNKTTILVNVGNGSYLTPFLISTQEELQAIGDENGAYPAFTLDKYYKLIADINLTGNFTPIAGEFNGALDFNGHTISGLNITTSVNGSSGLFEKIGIEGIVYNAKIIDVTINSDAANVGTVAGINYGSITKADLKGVSISSEVADVIAGGIVGVNKGTITKSAIGSSTIYASADGSVVGGIAGSCVLETMTNTAQINRSSAKVSLKASKAVGGIAGAVYGGAIENCYAGGLDAEYTISSNNATTFAGGIVGILETTTVNEKLSRSYVGDTYAVVKFNAIGYRGGIVGHNVCTPESANVIYGSYFASEYSEITSAIHTSDVNTTEYVAVNVEQIENLKTENTYRSFRYQGEDYYWDFINAWKSPTEETLPVLNYDADYIASRISYFQFSTIIDTYEKFMNLKNADVNTKYILAPAGDTLVLNYGSFKPFDFNSTLASVDGTTCTIKLVVDGDAEVADGVLAIFKSLGKDAVLKNINFEVEFKNVTAANMVAAIAGTNDGAIENCSAKGKITTASTDTIYMAGLVAVNNGSIKSSSSEVELSYAEGAKVVYVGGIAAINRGTITFTNNNGDITVERDSEAYVGGIVGHTTNAIKSCANHGEISGNIGATNAVYAGIAAMVVKDVNSEVLYCANYASIKGSNVGGIVGISAGKVEFCYCGADLILSGNKIGGLAYAVKQGSSDSPSYIKNSMTDGCVLVGLGENSVICGAVYSIDVTPEHTAYCQYIFSSCSFITNDGGEAYYESQSNIRGDSSNFWHLVSSIDPNAFNNSIHVSKSGNVIRSRFASDWYLQGRMKGQEDIEVSEEVATGTSGSYSIFRDNGYDSDIWEYNDATVGSYVKLKKVAA